MAKHVDNQRLACLVLSYVAFFNVIAICAAQTWPFGTKSLPDC